MKLNVLVGHPDLNILKRATLQFCAISPVNVERKTLGKAGLNLPKITDKQISTFIPGQENSDGMKQLLI